MGVLGVSDEECQNLDDSKAQVKTALNQSAEKPSWAAGQVRTLRVKYFKTHLEQEMFNLWTFFGLQ